MIKRIAHLVLTLTLFGQAIAGTPATTARPPAGLRLCSVPVTTTNKAGTLYTTMAAWANPLSGGVFVSTSTDGGKTFRTEQIAENSNTYGRFFHSLPHLVADPKKAGRVYLVWLQECTEPNSRRRFDVMFTYSEEGVFTLPARRLNISDISDHPMSRPGQPFELTASVNPEEETLTVTWVGEVTTHNQDRGTLAVSRISSDGGKVFTPEVQSAR